MCLCIPFVKMVYLTCYLSVPDFISGMSHPSRQQYNSEYISEHLQEYYIRMNVMTYLCPNTHTVHIFCYIL